MDLTLIHDGIFRLKNFRSRNKVKAEEEVLTCYLTLTGLVPARFFATLTGVGEDNGYRDFFWGSNDENVNFPGIGEIPFDAEATAHLVELGSGAKYADEDATIRRFRLKAEYGREWMATFEILVRPTQKAAIGRLAAAEGHDVAVSIKGPRQGDLLEGST